MGYARFSVRIKPNQTKPLNEEGGRKMTRKQPHLLSQRQPGDVALTARRWRRGDGGKHDLNPSCDTAKSTTMQRCVDGGGGRGDRRDGGMAASGDDGLGRGAGQRQQNPRDNPAAAGGARQ
jgi:hypothetical protein